MDKIKEYFSAKRVSNSLLSSVKNPRYMWLVRQGLVEDEEKVHFSVGAAIDCLLTSPERWEKDFEVVSVSRPTGFLGKFVQNLPCNIRPDSPLEDYMTAYQKSGYRKGIEWAVNNFWSLDDVVRYHRVNCNRGEKILLTTEMYDSVQNALELIKLNPWTKRYFHNFSNLTEEVLHQIPIYFEYMGVECKALLDGVIIDHALKTIQPWDLKSTGKSVMDFPSSYLTFGYYRQAAFYRLALESHEYLGQLISDGFKVLDYQFVVVETNPKSTRPALIYQTEPGHHTLGIYGGQIGSRYYPGINSLIEDYKWHEQSGVWDMPREVYLNEGVVKLTLDATE